MRPQRPEQLLQEGADRREGRWSGTSQCPQSSRCGLPDQPVCRLANLASRNSGVYNLFFGCVTATIVRIVPCADVLGVVIIKPGVEKRIRLLVT